VTPEPEEGQVWQRQGRRYEVLEAGDGTVLLGDRSSAEERTATVARRRFERDARDGVAVLHPRCRRCGLPARPGLVEGGLCRQCRFAAAPVAERCEIRSAAAGGSRLADEALRSGAPREHLLGVAGDPARSHHDRCDADELLTGAADVGAGELLDALVECPECGEGEWFPIDPATGEMSCHCGHRMKPPDEGAGEG
jgi:ribosomal protein S27AE